MVSNTRLDSLHMTHSLPLQGRISERLSCKESSSFSQILHISPIWDKITEVKNPYVLCKMKYYIHISVRLWNFKEGAGRVLKSKIFGQESTYSKEKKNKNLLMN